MLYYDCGSQFNYIIFGSEFNGRFYVYPKFGAELMIVLKINKTLVMYNFIDPVY